MRCSSDLLHAWTHSLTMRDTFAHPLHDPTRFMAQLRDPSLSEAWNQICSEAMHVESIFDSCRGDVVVRPSFYCDLCPGAPSFLSSKALSMHRRRKHGERCEVRKYAPLSAICPCCKTSFIQRFRLVAHLSDSRRPKCRDFVLSHCSELPPGILAEADATAAQERRKARKQGHTRPIASGGPAVNANGQRIGRAG